MGRRGNDFSKYNKCPSIARRRRRRHCAGVLWRGLIFHLAFGLFVRKTFQLRKIRVFDRRIA